MSDIYTSPCVCGCEELPAEVGWDGKEWFCILSCEFCHSHVTGRGKDEQSAINAAVAAWDAREPMKVKASEFKIIGGSRG